MTGRQTDQGPGTGARKDDSATRPAEAADSPARRDREPGSESQDFARTPGDGTLSGSTPAGTSVEEMKRLAETGGTSEPGTG
jgi:hypothetical protein